MIKFQYNKIEYIKLEKNLKIRQKALPTLKNKEAALRLEVHKRKNLVHKVEEDLKIKKMELEAFDSLFSELRQGILDIETLALGKKKIAGVLIPIFEDVKFKEKDLLVYISHLWQKEGLEALKDYIRAFYKLEVESLSLELLEKERRKTTQKVNLYEKVQIPEFKMAMKKIKRFLEDVENLDRASQKMMKQRIYEAEVM